MDETEYEESVIYRLSSCIFGRGINMDFRDKMIVIGLYSVFWQL